jgi:hypothetical protein
MSSASLAGPPTTRIAGRDEEVFHLVELYFTFMNDKPHSLFHEPSFKVSVLEGSASRTVLLSMMGLSARYECPTHLHA